MTRLRSTISSTSTVFLPGSSVIGRLDEAQADGAEILRVAPNFSLQTVRHILPYKDPATAERIVATLRKAGLK